MTPGDNNMFGRKRKQEEANRAEIIAQHKAGGTMEFTALNESKYIEAWEYLMRTGVPFMHEAETRYIALNPVADPHYDPCVTFRLKEILST